MPIPTTERKKAEEHVILKPPGTLACLHCGESYEVNMPAPMDVLIAAMKSFGATHKSCKQRTDGVVCTLCLEFGHAKEECPALRYNGDWRRWAEGLDTGVSSIAICKKLMPKGAHFGFEGSGRFGLGTTPRDPSDFGRCHRLLHAIPGWRARIIEMATEPGWANLVEHWDELEALYVEEFPTGSGPKLYERMKALGL